MRSFAITFCSLLKSCITVKFKVGYFGGNELLGAHHLDALPDYIEGIELLIQSLGCLFGADVLTGNRKK